MSFSALNALDRAAMRARLRELLALPPVNQNDLDRMNAARSVMAGRNISDIPKPDMISAILILSGDHAEYAAVTQAATRLRAPLVPVTTLARPPRRRPPWVPSPTPPPPPPPVAPLGQVEQAEQVEQVEQVEPLPGPLAS